MKAELAQRILDLSHTWQFRLGSPQHKILEIVVRMANNDYDDEFTRFDAVHMTGEYLKRLSVHQLPEVGSVAE